MAREGREFELMVKRLEEGVADTDLVVKSPYFVVGKHSKSRREVDVAVLGRLGSTDLFVMYECRDRDEVQGVDWIEQVIQKQADVGAQQVVVVSSGPFSGGAANIAANAGILLRTVEEVDAYDVFDWLKAEALSVRKRMAHLDALDTPSVTFGVARNTPAHTMKRFHNHPPDPKRYDEPLLQRLSDNTFVSLMDVWKTLYGETDYLAMFDGLAPGVHETRSVQVRLPSGEFQLPFGATTLAVEEIGFLSVEIWVEDLEVPFERFHRYVEDDRVLSESAETVVEHEGQEWIVGVHVSRTPDGGQRMAITVEASDPAKKPNRTDQAGKEK